MSDLLVNLLTLSPLDRAALDLQERGINIRRAQPFELTKVRSFVETNFSTAWADEVSVGFGNKPVSVYIATANGKIIGFAAHECTRRCFFGPTGVIDEYRQIGVGKALLLACLWALREMGYVYGIIGGVGPIDFYKKTVGAIEIPGSGSGIYEDLLK
jgi:predicted N-acetyltransferase YhbS